MSFHLYHFYINPNLFKMYAISTGWETFWVGNYI